MHASGHGLAGPNSGPVGPEMYAHDVFWQEQELQDLQTTSGQCLLEPPCKHAMPMPLMVRWQVKGAHVQHYIQPLATKKKWVCTSFAS